MADPSLPGRDRHYRLLAETVPDGILTIDEKSRILYANPAVERILGHPPEELLGRSLTDLMPEHLRVAHRKGFSRYVQTGERRVSWSAVEFPGLHKSGREVPLEISFAEVAEGDRRYFTGILRDVTGRKQAEEERARLLEGERSARLEAEAARGRLAFLAEASAALASDLDYSRTLATVARLAVPHLADWCVIDVLEHGGTLSRVAVVHSDPAKMAAAEELQRSYPPQPDSPRGVPNVLRTGRSELYPDIPESLLEQLARDPEHLRLLRSLGMRSSMVIPLLARGHAEGAITLVSAESGRRFQAEDLAFAEHLARRAATAVDNARLFRASVEAVQARDRALGDLQSHVRRQAAVAELGRRALGTTDLAALMDEALSLITQTLGADCCEVLECLPPGGALRLRAGLGWRAGLVGRAIVDGDAESQAGYTLLQGEAVVVENLAAETRFRAPPLLRDQGVVSGLTVVIHAGEKPFGVLGAHATRRREFTDEDARFLQALSHVLGVAIERERSRQTLRESEKRFRAMIENSSDAIALLDRDGTILYAGPSTTRVLGYSSEEFVGRNAYEFLHPDDVEPTRRLTAGLRGKPGTSVTTEYRVRHRDGSWRWVEGVATHLLHEPAVRAVVGNYRDITERKRAEERIQYQAHHDALTELPNRALFRDRLAHAVAHAQRSRRGLAVVYCDLDHFKRVNDALGHAAGDRLLRIAAERLQACVRNEDTVARVGGDEFILLLEDIGRVEDAALIGEKILESLARPLELEGHRLHVTTSLGISLFPADGQDSDTLLTNADNALYRAKDLGRNTYQLCTPELNRRAVERLKLEKALRHALDRDELVLHYQSEFDTHSGRIVGAEALLRWRHPEAGLLYPEEFIPLAEETRLILPIGDWVLRTVCQQAREWRESGLPALRLAVNLSGLQFQQQDLVRSIGRTLAEAGPEPNALEVEITETVAMRDTAATRVLLRSLRDLGIRIAIDDFGTGYSSLAALKRFPIQTLKIDQSFIADIRDDSAGNALVTAIISMGHSLALNVVAEGVETDEQLSFLKAKACDGVQGYLLGRPLPPAEFVRSLAD